jgi:hypothetical protein
MAEQSKADGDGENVTHDTLPVFAEFNQGARAWLDSLRTDDDPAASCDTCGATEGRMVYTGALSPVCEACAAYSHGYDHGEAGLVAELIVMGMEAVHRNSDTLSSECFEMGAHLAGERFRVNWKRGR